MHIYSQPKPPGMRSSQSQHLISPFVADKSQQPRVTPKDILVYRSHTQHRSNGVSPRNDLGQVRLASKVSVTPTLSNSNTPRQHYLPVSDRPDSVHKKHRNPLEIATSIPASPRFGTRSQSALIRNPALLSEVTNSAAKFMLPASTSNHFMPNRMLKSVPQSSRGIGNLPSDQLRI